ncbi:MAG: hypothetical protein ABGW81_10235 [Paracoccaceae bacterium]
MTALDKYTRLEALGQWRESPEHTPTEVVVSFGNATLLLSDLNETPLGHWAMAATSRLSVDGSKATYTPDSEGFETLEIDDAQMVEAIAQVSLYLTGEIRKAPWLRWVFLTTLISALAALSYVTPQLLRDQAIRITGPESARKLGADMIATLGIQICREPRADAARDLFQSRVFPEGSAVLVIAKDDPNTSIFPGGIVLIAEKTLRKITSPTDLARLTTSLIATNDNVVAQLFAASTVRELLMYITSGKLSNIRLAEAAENAVTQDQVIETVTDAPATANQVILRDQDWVALQGICLE